MRSLTMGLRMLAALLCWLAAAGAAAQSVDPLPFADRAEEERFQRLAHELRCVQCQNNSLADSDGMIARDIRHDVHRLMRAGRSDEQIKTHLVERYCDFVLYKPALEPLTWPLYFGPALLLLAGGFVLWRLLRRRAAQSGPAEPAEET
jgi:cytochrome c-type biogenesis protein CcmH